MLAIAHFFVIVFDDYANLPGSLKIKENRKNTGNRVPMCKNLTMNMNIFFVT